MSRQEKHHLNGSRVRRGKLLFESAYLLAFCGVSLQWISHGLVTSCLSPSSNRESLWNSRDVVQTGAKRRSSSCLARVVPSPAAAPVSARRSRSRWRTRWPHWTSNGRIALMGERDVNPTATCSCRVKKPVLPRETLESWSKKMEKKARVTADFKL
jgi:hypothetical protein